MLQKMIQCKKRKTIKSSLLILNEKGWISTFWGTDVQRNLTPTMLMIILCDFKYVRSIENAKLKFELFEKFLNFIDSKAFIYKYKSCWYECRRLKFFASFCSAVSKWIWPFLYLRKKTIPFFCIWVSGVQMTEWKEWMALHRFCFILVLCKMR